MVDIDIKKVRCKKCNGYNIIKKGKRKIKRIKREKMICKICGIEKTGNPDGFCEDCKFCIISNNDIPPNL